MPGLQQLSCLQEAQGLIFWSLHILSTSPGGWCLVGTNELIWPNFLIQEMGSLSAEKEETHSKP